MEYLPNVGYPIASYGLASILHHWDALPRQVRSNMKVGSLSAERLNELRSHVVCCTDSDQRAKDKQLRVTGIKLTSEIYRLLGELAQKVMTLPQEVSA